MSPEDFISTFERQVEELVSSKEEPLAAKVARIAHRICEEEYPHLSGARVAKNLLLSEGIHGYASGIEDGLLERFVRALFKSMDFAYSKMDFLPEEERLEVLGSGLRSISLST